MSTGTIFNEDQNGRKNVFSQAGVVLPLDIQLRSLLQFIENSRSILNEVRMDFSLSRSHTEDSIILQRAAKRLARFYTDVDSWGFDALYKVAFGLQVLLVKTFNRAKNDCYWEILNQGLTLLSSLLNQCESDYHQRLAVANILDSFERASCH